VELPLPGREDAFLQPSGRCDGDTGAGVVVGAQLIRRATGGASAAGGGGRPGALSPALVPFSVAVEPDRIHRRSRPAVKALRILF
jgi:hypothetical protein